jgi:hypothetical protein
MVVDPLTFVPDIHEAEYDYDSDSDLESLSQDEDEDEDDGNSAFSVMVVDTVRKSSQQNEWSCKTYTK